MVRSVAQRRVSNHVAGRILRDAALRAAPQDAAGEKLSAFNTRPE
jgi:hypothetical protein